MASPSRLVAAAALLSALFFGSASEADVVFGNLGTSGTGALGGTNTDYGPIDTGELSLAQGFNTGSSSLLDIQSVTLGLFVSNSGTSENRSVSIYTDSSGTPGSILATSQAVAVGNTGKYTFPFSGATLSASTPYWIVPSGPASWYLNTPDSAPSGLNSSGYSYTGTLRNAPSVGWTTPSPALNSYSVSVVAVPEPSAMALSGIGIASAVYFLRRRRG